MPAKIRHLPWLVCLVLLMAACSGGHDSGASRGDNGDTGTSVSRGAHETGDEGGGDPDADLPGSDRGPEIPEDAFLAQRLLPSGVPNLKAFDAAGAQATQIRTLTNRLAPALTRAGWKFLGPKTVGGRVVDAAVDPQQEGGLYVATSTAGVWHSTDSGATFTSVWPSGITHSMGALAIAPDGTLYAGTGETNPGGGSITYGGDGVYRSTDGGATWKHVGLESAGTIGRIVIDPQNPQRIWVAVSGNLFVPGGQRGVYVSTDGGDSWKRSLKPPNDTTGAADITVDPTDPAHLVTGLWDHLRQPDDRRYTGIGSGIWETHNGGTSWQRLGAGEGLPARSADTGRIGVAFAPSNGHRLYAIYANNVSGSFQNFFTSTDNGASWTRPSGADDLNGSQSTYGWWFARIFVDPADAKHLYVAGLGMSQSSDGAGSFSGVGGLHADQHIAVWDTHQGGDVYIGNDGGLYASANGGTSWTRSPDEPWSQYVSVDVSEQDPSRFLGGLQDNGTRASWTSPPFQDIIGGDGERALISPTDKNTYYGCYQYGNCTGFSGGGQFGMPFKSDRFPFFMQMGFQPGDPSVIYGGGNELNRSTDGGRTFTTLTGDLGHGGGGSSSYPYGTISAIGIAPGNPKVIWVGTDNGYLYRSTDKGAQFIQLTSPVHPRLWITRIAIDPTNSTSVFVTFTGYRAGDNAPYVLHSTNSGKTWTDISVNLPKAPVSDLLIIGSKLYVGTDVGVFTSAIDNPSWKSVGHGIPQLIITDLRYVSDNSTLYAATFGMGVWSVTR
ncbi:MAG: glycosyl hydrolase [Actinomycetota bacterium]|nr:glycosyl hydrolase [Actinomycetota bacterium]